MLLFCYVLLLYSLLAIGETFKTNKMIRYATKNDRVFKRAFPRKLYVTNILNNNINRIMKT